MSQPENDKRVPGNLRATMTFDAWRKQKRAEIKALEEALTTVRLGSVFLPPGAYAKVTVMYNAMKELKRLTSAKQWGH